MSELQPCYRPLASPLLVLAILALFGGMGGRQRYGSQASGLRAGGHRVVVRAGIPRQRDRERGTFNQNELTAAHRSLPLGTKVAVTNVTNGKSVEINDRGPYVNGRVIDLSRAAAIRLGMKDAGLAKVQIEAIPSYKG